MCQGREEKEDSVKHNLTVKGLLGDETQDQVAWRRLMLKGKGKGMLHIDPHIKM